MVVIALSTMEPDRRFLTIELITDRVQIYEQGSRKPTIKLLNVKGGLIYVYIKDIGDTVLFISHWISA